MIRYITVPKDKNAEIALNYDDAQTSQLIELVFADEESFKELWASGIFTIINHIAGSNIDLYESDSIDDINVIKRILASGVFESNDFSNLTHILSVKAMFQHAFNFQTSIHFYF